MSSAMNKSSLSGSKCEKLLINFKRHKEFNGDLRTSISNWFKLVNCINSIVIMWGTCIPYAYVFDPFDLVRFIPFYTAHPFI